MELGVYILGYIHIRRHNVHQRQRITVLVGIDRIVQGYILRRFAVVAEEIKTLAENSKTTADDSNKNNKDIKETISNLVREAEKLSTIVESVNTRAKNLVSSSEETASSIDNMQVLTGKVESSLKEVIES